MLRWLTTVLLSVMFADVALPARAEVPVFVGGVDYAALDNQEGIDTAKLKGQNGLYDQLNRKMRRWIDADAKFAQFQQDDLASQVELPDGLLLVVVGVCAADLVRWRTDLPGGRKLVELKFRLGLDLQIVDPMSGQVVYADSDYFLREEWDKDGHYRSLSADDQDDAPHFKEGAVDTTAQFGRLLELSLEKITRDMLARFDPQPLTCQVARVLNRRKGEFVLNQGRNSGVFANMRFHSQKDGKLASVVESFPEYCIANVLPGFDVPEQWESFRAYKVAIGSVEAQALTTVTRIVFADGMLDQRGLGEPAFIKQDEERLEKSLVQSGAARKPVYQAFFSKALTDKLAQTGKFRLGFPVGGLSSLKKAKIRLNDALNLKRREGDPFFHESFLLPDFGLTALVSNLSRQETKITGGHTATYRVIVSLNLYNLYNGEIVASGLARGERSIQEAEYKDTVTLGNETKDVLIANLISGTLGLAVKKLDAAYKPENLVGEITGGDAEELEIRFPEGASLYVGKPLTICSYEGDLPLVAGGTQQTPIFRSSARVVLEEAEGDHWIARIEQGQGFRKNESTPRRVLLFGANSAGNQAKWPHRIKMGRITIGSDAASVISKSDVRHLFFANMAAHPKFQLVFDDGVRRKLRRFDRVKFVRDGSFQTADDQVQENAKWSHDVKPDLTAFVDILQASAEMLSDNIVKKTKEVDLRFRLAFGLKEADNSDVFKPMTYTLAKTKTVPIESLDGPAYARDFISGIAPRLIDAFCTKRIGNK